MKRTYKKDDFPVWNVRRFLEPGPAVLVSSYWKGQRNIMTMGWYTVMEFSPSLIGCMITSANYSYELIRKSKACVINLPTVDLMDQVVGIGNCSGTDTDKFKKFGFTPVQASTVDVPLIRECYANFECRVVDEQLLSKYNFFILEVLKAQVAVYPTYPRTVHYRGDGVFMVSGKQVSLPEKFLPQNL